MFCEKKCKEVLKCAIIIEVRSVNMYKNGRITRAEYRKRKQRKKIKWTTILITSIVIAVVCIINIFLWNHDNQKLDKINDDIDTDKIVNESQSDTAENINPPENKSDDYWNYIKMDMMSVNFDELKKKNNDTVGFIKVNGTNVNYPIVQTTDNSYYLKHAFDKSQNSAGWVFADYRNDMVNFDKNTVIYGHSRSNQTVFGSLKKVLNKSWYGNKDNHVIKLSTPTENTLWQIVSIYTIKPESYYITTKFSDKQFKEFIKTIKNRSEIDFSGTLNENDKILTLSTCEDVAGTTRLVIHAKLIKSDKR